MTRVHPDSFTQKKTVCSVCGSTKGWRIELRLYVKNQTVCRCNGYWFPHRYNSPMCLDRRMAVLSVRQFVPQALVAEGCNDALGQQFFKVGNLGCCSAQDEQQAKRLLMAYIDLIGSDGLSVSHLDVEQASVSVVDNPNDLMLYSFEDHDSSDNAVMSLQCAYQESCKSAFFDSVLSVGQLLYSVGFDSRF